MTKEQILELIRDNLKVVVELSGDHDYYSNGFCVTTRLILDDETISESSDTFMLSSHG